MTGRHGTSLVGRFGHQNEGLVYYGDEGRETSIKRLMTKLELDGKG